MQRHFALNYLFAVALLLPLAPAARAQRGIQAPDASLRSPNDPQRRLGTMEEEVIKRAEIKRDEESHTEMLERADEAAQLGAELREAFGKQKTFGREDLKRLEKMEKLARKIRSKAGGSDDEQALENLPSQLEEAVVRLAEVSVRLNESVRKTTRHVVSGAVIEHSNELIELVRHVRSLNKP